ncbi:peptidase [Clostridium kluyveri]|uniref:Peptidase n=2 Tax=Clostridium kluyveri TaxID=1534 RepID=A0A1L5F7G2_CLOKL|nr:peptidase [Clostridium kluyveri]
MEIFIKNLLYASIVGSIEIMSIIVLKTTLLKRYTCAFNYYIWLAVIFKMITPFKIPIYIPEKISYIFQHSPNNVKTIIESGISLSESMKIKNNANIITANYPIENYFIILFYIWLIVSIILLSYHIISYIIFNNKIKHFIYDVPDSEIRNIYSKLLVEMNIKRKISLKLCWGISTPLGIGIFNSHILIPCVSYDNQELKYILKHELMHYKRHDMIYKILLLITVTVYWFNPLVYIMYKIVSNDCELSCDEAVLKKSNMKERKLYASTLINSLRLNKNNVIKQNLITGFNNNKNILKRRLENMLNLKIKQKGVIWGILITVIVVCSFISVNVLAEATKNNSTSAIENTKTQQQKITSDNYSDALQEYIKDNPTKFDKDNPTKILDDFMKENNLDHLTVDFTAPVNTD